MNKTKKQGEQMAPNPMQAVFHSALRTVGLVKLVMDNYFAPFGISGPQWGVLRVLQRAENAGETGLRLTDLGQRLLIQPPSVTGVVDRLERLGLVKRSDSKSDLRVRRVGLTAEGRKLVERVLANHSGQIKLLFNGFNAEELEVLFKLLKRWETHLSSLAGGRGRENSDIAHKSELVH